MKVKRKCELCSNVATIYCESDQASLCFECDSRIHGANFLVAKHSRTLLCHVCQTPTPWTGSGPKLGPTISVCQTCFKADRQVLHGDIRNGHPLLFDDTEDEGHDDDVSDQECDEDDDDGDDHGSEEYDHNDNVDDDGDNQVVPWYSGSHPR